MSGRPERLRPFPLAAAGPGDLSLDEAVNRPLETFPTFRWWVALLLASSLAAFFYGLIAYTVSAGIGVWGNNQPVGWAFDITNFVFWIGIGHAGTLISAILFLLRQKWRTGIARLAEAMTLFAVLCALQFPLFHTGRPWLAWAWLLPYPNHMGVWINFRSPLVWDVIAVSTYGLVSFFFWYTGLLPDLATVRDRARHPWRKFLYGLLSLGWQGSARAWHHYEKAYLLFAGLATPLVLSVHSVVSFDFAVSVIPGWHTTLFPPYFVAGAILSGFAMVATVVVLLRRFFHLQHLITEDHLDVMNKITLATSLMVGYAYLTELFIAWQSGSLYERYLVLNRACGFYGWGYWVMVAGNVLLPQLFWFRQVRRRPWLFYPVALLINVGMWLERFVIIVGSLHRDYLPSSWGYFFPTWVDLSLLAGSFGLFFTLVLLFCRFFPTLALSELKGAAGSVSKMGGANVPSS